MSHTHESVVAYLQQHGLQQSAEVMREELDEMSAGASQALEEAGETRRTGSAEPDAYMRTYVELHEWINDNLDAFRDELWPLSWAIYVHFFLDQMLAGHTIAAHKFLQQFQSEHVHAHHDEIQQLDMVQTTAHLLTNEYTRRLLVDKQHIHINMSKYARDLFVFFCIGQKLLLALSVFHTRVKVDAPNNAQSSSAPLPGLTASSSGIGHRFLSDAYTLGSNSGVIAGISDASRSELNRRPMFWGVPREMHPKKEVPSNSAAVPQAVATTRNTLYEHIIRPLLQRNDKETTAAKESARVATSGAGGNLDDTASASTNLNGTAANGSGAKNVSTAMEVDGKSGQTTSILKTNRGATSKQSQSNKQAVSQWPNIALFTVFNARDALTCVDISHDSTIVAAGLNDSKVLLYEAGRGGTDVAATKQAIWFGQDSRALVGHSGTVYSCSISRDNLFLVTASEDGTTRLWVSLTSEMQSTAKSVKGLDPNAFHWRNLVVYRQAPFAPIWAVKFAPWGYYFVTGSQDRAARIYCTDRTTPLRLLVGHLSDVSCVAWHPNCQFVATGSWDKTIRVWDVATGETVRLFCGHLGPVTALVIDPTGRYLASGGMDKLVMIWDLKMGTQVSVLRGHTKPVWSLAYSDDSKFLASGGGDCSVRLWATSVVHARQHTPMSDNLNGEGSRKRKGEETKENSEGGMEYKGELRSLASNAVRVFHTKYTPVMHVSFKAGNLLTAVGSLNLSTRA